LRVDFHAVEFAAPEGLGAAYAVKSRVASSGQARSPDNRRIYSRDQIRELYERHRKGAFGNDEWERIEQDIFQAQHEGRIQGAPYLTK
jgi:hypothetical protein